MRAAGILALVLTTVVWRQPTVASTIPHKRSLGRAEEIVPFLDDFEDAEVVPVLSHQRPFPISAVLSEGLFAASHQETDPAETPAVSGPGGVGDTCLSGSDCESGLVCTALVCAEAAILGGACTQSTDCAGGVCEANTCVEAGSATPTPTTTDAEPATEPDAGNSASSTGGGVSVGGIAGGVTGAIVGIVIAVVAYCMCCGGGTGGRKPKKAHAHVASSPGTQPATPFSNLVSASSPQEQTAIEEQNSAALTEVPFGTSFATTNLNHSNEPESAYPSSQNLGSSGASGLSTSVVPPPRFTSGGGLVDTYSSAEDQQEVPPALQAIQDMSVMQSVTSLQDSGNSTSVFPK